MKKTILVLLLASGLSLCGAGRRDYIDLIEQAVSAYTPERIADYIDDVDRRGICEHGFARLTSNLATLVADGRMPERRDLLKRMMELCAREQPRAHLRNGKANTGHFAVGTEFAMKELVFALVELEKAKVYPKETTDAWRAAFASVVPARDYSCQPKVGDPVAHNWTIFGTASEQVRLWAKAGGDAAWMEKYVADQLRFFDANGMYRDPHNPMVYDIVPRVQFATMLACGYDGPSRAALEETLDRSAQLTLEMQSVTGEIPYGGRSNQFLHNEILYAALCEWYAARAAKGGDRALAGRFRAAADRAVRHVRGWLAKKPVRHVKNCYPTESGYGCEKYAYFNKYMVTMGSWAYLASRFVDESVPLATTPEPDSVFVTGPDFHRVMTSAGGYTLEFDLDGQEGYDASGLGRLQRAGAPSALALSVPFPVNAHYRMDVTNDLPRAIGPRWGKFALVSAKAGEIVLSDGGDARWTSRVTPAGVDLKVAQKGAIGFDLPVFAFDGETSTSVTSGLNWIEVAYAGWICRYETTGLFRDTGKVLGNRNGHYRLFEAQGEDRLTVRAKIAK